MALPQEAQVHDPVAFCLSALTGTAPIPKSSNGGASLASSASKGISGTSDATDMTGSG